VDDNTNNEGPTSDEVTALKAMSAMLDIVVMLLDNGQDREVADMVSKLPQKAATALLALAISEIAYQRKRHGTPQINFGGPKDFPGQSTREHLDNL